jgi:TetR/AcrR family transcriptional regulator
MPVLRSHTPKGQRAQERILVAAERLFASRGFHGTSLRDVAAAARLPLATAVYHFPRKEKLYGAVLEAIANELVAELEVAFEDGAWGEDVDAWNDRLFAYAAELVGWITMNPECVRLLMRELLDNPMRVAKAAKLPLAPFLEKSCVLVARAAEAGAIVLSASPEMLILHVVGAIGYYVVAQPTLERIVGEARARKLERAYENVAIVFACQMLGVAAPKPQTREEMRHARAVAASAGEARPRSSRAAHDRQRR